MEGNTLTIMTAHYGISISLFRDGCNGTVTGLQGTHKLLEAPVNMGELAENLLGKVTIKCETLHSRINTLTYHKLCSFHVNNVH